MTSARDEQYARQEAELDDLYREIIVDHYRNPRHKGALAAPTATCEGENPLCGDEVTVSVAVDDDRL
ncbi:MAG TPA: iron-sulfur cluster assembly scaffold protein, partial [Dehalococcoidia bacterium]|nr:iron-sulfur cluster assembly scaffold protein [Dehalococcoidia bacterium]